MPWKKAATEAAPDYGEDHLTLARESLRDLIHDSRLPEGVRHAASLETALERARRAGDDEAFVAGGAQIYRLALAAADTLYLTRVHAEVEGDVRFPDVEWDEWERVESEEHPADERHDFDFTFEVWGRGIRAPRESPRRPSRRPPGPAPR